MGPGSTLHAPADVSREERSGDDRERKAEDERIEERAARIGAQPLDCGERSGMRRNETVRR